MRCPSAAPETNVGRKAPVGTGRMREMGVSSKSLVAPNMSRNAPSSAPSWRVVCGENIRLSAPLLPSMNAPLHSPSLKAMVKAAASAATSGGTASGNSQPELKRRWTCERVVRISGVVEGDDRYNSTPSSTAGLATYLAGGRPLK